MRLLDKEYPTWLLDVKFREQSRLIACAVLETHQGLTLIDPGPSTTLHTLEHALEPWGGLVAVRNVVLTHIHLDHAGCVGRIVDILPEVNIHVHPIGARHLINPEKLVQSARRIYGDQMDLLWGEILPIPKSQVHAIEDGTVLDVGGRRLRSCYTPGHASHHISWLDDAAGWAFAGDAAGMRIEGTDYIVPVSPPPDIDLILWEASLDRLEIEAPEKLFLTHFGVVDDVKEHISGMRSRLRNWAYAVRKSLEDHSGSDADASCARAFHASEMKQMRSTVDPSFQQPYNYMGQPGESWYGLARYFRKRAAAGKSRSAP